jgi:opacity protein-like surface antigen
MRGLEMLRIGWLVAVVIGVAAPVAAAEDSSNAPPWAGSGASMFEVSALGALAVGGRFRVNDSGTAGAGHVSLPDHGAFALTADLDAGDGGSQYELFYSREGTGLRGDFGTPRTDLTLEYLHLGGTVLLYDELPVKPYLAGGLGISRFSPDGGFDTDTRFSVSLGMGLKWHVTPHFSLRVEGRGFVTLMDADAAVFCRSDESGSLCRIHGNGQTFVQGEFLAGASLAF